MSRFVLNSLLNHADKLRARADLNDAMYTLVREDPDQAEQILRWAGDPKAAARLDEAYGKGTAIYIAEVLRDAIAHNPVEDRPIVLSTVVANFWRKLRGN